MPHSTGSPSNSGFAYLYSTQTTGLLSCRRIYKRKSIASAAIKCVENTRKSEQRRDIRGRGLLYLTRIDPNTGIYEGFFLSFFFEGFVMYYSQMSWPPSEEFSSGQKPQELGIGGNLETQQFSSIPHLVYLFSNTWMLYKYIERRCSP